MSDATNPYRNLSSSSRWSRASKSWHQTDFGELYTPKFIVHPSDRIATAGSCFAQHIGAQLKERGFNFVDYEPAPLDLPKSDRPNFGYGIYSARYGNIYTVRQLLSLVRAAFGTTVIDEVWEEQGRYRDPLRPTIEPEGFSCLEELLAARKTTFDAIQRMVREIDVFVFTLGLTETWTNRKTGLGYQICPGTTAGVFDPDQHCFTNMTYPEIYGEMVKILTWWRKLNKTAKFILTVSPVPLAATASGQHVVAATTYSKSVLRAVAGDLRERFEFVDYFPSYEIITSNIAPTDNYGPDRRNVRPESVSKVMDCFFASHGAVAYDAPPSEPVSHKNALLEEMRIVCEEAALDQS